MFNNPKVAALQARSDPNTYIRYWKIGLCKAPCARPGFCCYAMWCPNCASFGLRKQALHNDMKRYICCNGDCPCSGHCCESSCPSCCLCMEVTCCMAMSVAATRYMIQDELLIQTTGCDTCIITTMIVLEYVACICHIIACITGSEEARAAAHITQLIADLVWCSVCACMQTQHKEELDERDSSPQAYARPAALMAPPVQMIPMAPTAGGYPSNAVAPAPYGAPSYPYPPAAPGYPPQPYPQASPYPAYDPYAQAGYSPPPMAQPQYAPPAQAPAPYPYPQQPQPYAYPAQQMYR